MNVYVMMMILMMAVTIVMTATKADYIDTGRSLCMDFYKVYHFEYV